MSNLIKIDPRNSTRDHAVYTGDNFEQFILELPSMSKKEVSALGKVLLTYLAIVLLLQWMKELVIKIPAWL